LEVVGLSFMFNSLFFDFEKYQLQHRSPMPWDLVGAGSCNVV